MSCDEEPAMADPAFANSPASAATACSICLDPVLEMAGRSVAKLACGHEFHLDCIGSAFNAKGAMQCPNCRKIELGCWLYANGHRAPADFDFDNWVSAGDLYDQAYSEIPFGFQWCPIRGFTQMSSVFEDGEPQPISYHAFGDNASVSSSSQVCPYVALHGLLHPMSSSSSSVASSTEAATFLRHPSSMEAQPATYTNNQQYFSAVNPQAHDPDSPYINTFPPGTSDQQAPQFGVGLSRYDNNRHQGARSVAHHHPVLQGRNTSHGVTNVVSPLGHSAVSDGRAPLHGARDHAYPQFVPSVQNNSFPNSRRIRPRALTITSFIAAASSAEIGPLGFSFPGAASRSIPDGNNIGRHLDQPYLWDGEAYAPLPWIPVDGESHWWGPVNPTTHHTPPQGFARRVGATERIPQNRPENIGFTRVPPLRMPSYQQ